MTAPRRAATYARISSDPSDQQAGVDRQCADTRALVDRSGWTLTTEYVDNNVSAFSGAHRPAYQRLLSDIRGGLVDVVVVWHIDRIGRRISDLIAYTDLTSKHGVDTVTVTAGDIDISTAAGRLNLHMLASIAEYESSHRSERIARAHRQRAVDGRWSGGRRAYGYAIDGTSTVAAEADDIRSATAAILRGESLRSVVADWNARGRTTPTGRTFTSTSVRSILTAPTIAGLSAHHGEIVGKGQWPSIITEAEYHALAAIFGDPSRRTNTRGNAVRYLGSGIYRCGVCGSNDMRVSHTSDGRVRYRCRNRVKGDPQVHVGRDQPKLDAYIESVVVARLQRADIVNAVAAASHSSDVTDLMNQRNVLVERQVQLAESFADGAITRKQLESATARIEHAVAELDSRFHDESGVSPLVGIAGAVDVAAIWADLTLSRKRAILTTLVDVVILPTKSGRAIDGTYFRADNIELRWL